MDAAAAVLRHTSDAGIERIDTTASVKTEQHVVSVVADGDDSAIASDTSRVSFFTSFVQHLTLLLEFFEMLVDTVDDDGDDVACEYCSVPYVCLFAYSVITSEFCFLFMKM